ncbi:MAG: hypothetical protein ACLP81_06420, partial [Acidimicrobiales bacterium]
MPSAIDHGAGEAVSSRRWMALAVLCVSLLIVSAKSTGERNGSCEMSESRSQEDTGARTTWPSQRGTEAARVPPP